MMKHKVLITAALYLAALAACTNSEALTVPTLPRETEGPLAAKLNTLTRIDVAEGYACPIVGDDTLIVFSEPVSASAAKSITVGDVTIKVGDSFETSVTHEIPDGFECGGKLYPQAEHVIFPGVNLVDLD